ncbi:fimbrial protein [Enterobacteriaceae bacterium RIT714]|nr:fimbrial protein [Enterobacteriaceae bacterium RIT714]
MSKLKTTACAIALSMISAYSFAAGTVTQGTVTFTGKLIADTCSIVAGDEDLQVILPTLSIQSLAKSGATAGTTTFNIHVESCPSTLTDVAAHFEAINSDGFNATTQNLTNSTLVADGGAANVEVRLFDKDGSSQLPVGGTGSFFPVDATSHKATMTYIGGYYATGVTTAGDVTAKVQYTLAYK